MDDSSQVRWALGLVAGLLDAIKAGECPHLQHFETALRELEGTLPTTKDMQAFHSLFYEHPELLGQAIRMVADRISAVSEAVFQSARDVRRRLSTTEAQRSLTAYFPHISASFSPNFNHWASKQLRR